MSVVARQGFKYSLIGYFGFLLGTVSSVFIFPQNVAFYGKIRYIIPTAEMLLPIVVFGLSFSNVKFFERNKSFNREQNFLSLSLVGVLLHFIIFLLGFFLFFWLFPEYKTTELWSLRKIVLPLILVLAFSAIFNKYISNFKRIVVPNIFENLFPKIASLGAFCLLFYLGFSETISLSFFFLMFVSALVGYFLYTNKLQPLKFDFRTDYIQKDNFWKLVLNYSFFGFLGNIGNYIAFRVDNFMIGEMIGMEANGIYSIMLSVLSFIMIPQMGLNNISAPIINKSIEDNNFEELDAFHKKTSLSLFFLGSVLFSCILVGFPWLTHFIKNGDMLLQGEPVIWILGFGMLIDLATGFNGHIISLSKYYRFNILVMAFLAFLTIGLNLLFINTTELGIIGVALATALSLSIFNIIKILFNYIKFKVSPLSMEMVYVMLMCSSAITIVLLLPDSAYPFVNLVYKPLMVLILIAIGNHFLKIYPLEKYINKDFIKSLLKF